MHELCSGFDITQQAVKDSGIPRKLYLIARPRSYRERMRAVAEEFGIEMPQMPTPPPPDPAAPDADAKAVEEAPPPRPFGVDDEMITTHIDHHSTPFSCGDSRASSLRGPT